MTKSYAVCGLCKKPIRDGQEHIGRVHRFGGNEFVHRRCGSKLTRNGGQCYGPAN
jgi:hypothetical protein